MRPAPACVAIYLLLLLLARAAAAAETCPEPPADEDIGARRALAKDWFARAEEAEAGGDRQSAVRRYACSLKLIPHPSTAYNLGSAAEKSGDVSMAIDAFKVYLNLAPDAADRASVEARVQRLETKLAELRQQIELKPHPPPPGPPANSGAGQAGGAGPAASATRPAPRPAPPARHRVSGWVALAGATAAIGTGITFNLLARAKMNDCYAGVAAGNAGALDQCDAARPFAYGSYGLFALAGVLGVTGAAILLWNPDEGTKVSLVPTPGGGALVAGGHW
jgi:tetratricopeptide (TPR) repeat protein